MTGATLHQCLYWSPSADSRCLIDFIGLTNPWLTATLGGNFERMRASAVTQALRRNPTFLTVWLGNNDTVISGMLGTSKYLTPVEAWQRDWEELVRRIKATPSVKGVVLLNLPYIDSAAYLQPVANPYHKPRGQITPGSLVPFFARESYGDADVLTPAELARIRARVDSFNAIIRQTSEREGWPLVDVNAVLVNLGEGGLRLRRADGSLSEVVLKRDYATGGLFSLDGLHPTSPAYAYVANEVIKAVNARYGTQVQLIDEVALWRQDSLCQNPVDPRGRLDFTVLSDAYNLFCSFLTRDPELSGGAPARPLPPAPR
ncbi:MAG: hypothetical protein BWY87_01295 [Deltaproteobacteria bacterium ADurb.Bin510]|nr:MAG: hypothetical protein BWY87_01295 [Deltaproteobacteria bacterium ADurb.Bin510]